MYAKRDDKNKDVLATFSFTAGGKSYEVLRCNYGFSQNYDASNKPSGFPSINVINLVVKATDETEFVDWMVSPRAEKDGEIVIKLTESRFRKINFKRGYCVDYSENFDSYSGNAFLINMAILAKEIKINEITYKVEWNY